MHNSCCWLHDEREAFGTTCNRDEVLRSNSKLVRGSIRVQVRQ